MCRGAQLVPLNSSFLQGQIPFSTSRHLSFRALNLSDFGCFPIESILISIFTFEIYVLRNMGPSTLLRLVNFHDTSTRFPPLGGRESHYTFVISSRPFVSVVFPLLTQGNLIYGLFSRIWIVPPLSFTISLCCLRRHFSTYPSISLQRSSTIMLFLTLRATQSASNRNYHSNESTPFRSP